MSCLVRSLHSNKPTTKTEVGERPVQAICQRNKAVELSEVGFNGSSKQEHGTWEDRLRVVWTVQAQFEVSEGKNITGWSRNHSYNIWL